MSDTDRIEASVMIRRPVDQVFSFYRDFRNLPSFLGDVMAVELTSPTDSRWTIQGPLGMEAHFNIQLTEEYVNRLVRYQTVTLPGMRTYWEIYFAPGAKAGQTGVREVMKVSLGRFGRAVLALIGKAPVCELAANLQRLKQLLEPEK
jgi:uncharacterized membrane protein